MTPFLPKTISKPNGTLSGASHSTSRKLTGQALDAHQRKQMFADCPDYLKEYLNYLLTIKGRSIQTVQGYYIDLRTFLRFAKAYEMGNFQQVQELTICDIPLETIRHLTVTDLYEYLSYCMRTLSNGDKARARKISALRGFYKYLNNVNYLEENPTRDLEVPSVKKSLPKYLTLDESITMLESVEGSFPERDFCMLTLFLNCGMRVSELVGINLRDIKNDMLRLLGKGNKERMVYLNQPCLDAIAAYMKVRQPSPTEPNALFLTKNGQRICKRRVQQIMEDNFRKNGLIGYSTHKLRHTAATLMYQYGHVDIRVLKELLGHVNISTTEIYTHLTSTNLEQAAQQTPFAKIKLQPSKHVAQSEDKKSVSNDIQQDVKQDDEK